MTHKSANKLAFLQWACNNFTAMFTKAV